MCTISWALHHDGYDVFFNRDEANLRSKALPPVFDEEDGCGFMAPIDPDGGGTWIVVNESGLTIALLNYYQGILPKGRLKSRGQIVLGLKRLQTQYDLEKSIARFDLKRFAPFSLFVFDVKSVQKKPVLFRWTGRELQTSLAESPVFSSAFRYEQVAQARSVLFSRTVKLEGLNRSEQVSLLERFHHSHEPRASAYSVCMHRDDARTVSCSHVSVNAKKVSFRYWDGAPCEVKEAQQLEFSRVR